MIELLVVIAVAAILLTLTVTGFNNILGSSRMDQAGRMVVDEINLARQTAAARNENVELRFIRKPRTDGSASDVYWQVQAGVLSKTDSTVFSPLKAPSSLPTGVALETDSSLSPLLAAGSEVSSTSPAYNYRAMTFRPTGELEPVGSLQLNQLPAWSFTIVSERQLGQPLEEMSDFITVQLDPLTGRPRVYRP